MESFENELYICLKDKEGNYFPFYNIKGTFSNNMKGGGNVVDNLTNIINFEQFNKNIKSQNNIVINIEEPSSSSQIPSDTNLEKHENSKIDSIDEYYEETGGNNNNEILKENNMETNSIIPQDFVDFFKKKLENF